MEITEEARLGLGREDANKRKASRSHRHPPLLGFRGRLDSTTGTPTTPIMTEPPMRSIRLTTLGRIGLDCEGGTGQCRRLLEHPKRFAVFLYLAAYPGTLHTRDTLGSVFWAESDAEGASNALRQSLHVIRQDLGPSILLSHRGGTLEIDARRVFSDVGLRRNASFD